MPGYCDAKKLYLKLLLDTVYIIDMIYIIYVTYICINDIYINNIY